MPTKVARKKKKEDRKEWTEQVGFCGHCLLSLIADQPGGHGARHQDGIPYGLCRQALTSSAKLSKYEHDSNPSAYPGF